MNDGSISEVLDQFLGTNFHQDWDLEADDWEGIVDNYAKMWPLPERLRALALEIDHMRKSRPEPDLKQFLVRNLGVDYRPHPLTYKEWLGQVAGRLREHASRLGRGPNTVICD
ncbi:contact-dependent growth inhibition system immunity protein [Mycobacterium sp. SMC-4]|uniref:contact-dependent growth inhibition system immunity protein n=1 Tax=Mycobacterium sp. SMC-4 TaxID=2857059 RepID=UPI003D0122AB